MTFLEKTTSNDYRSTESATSDTAKIQTRLARNHFDLFCKAEYENRLESEVIAELKIYKERVDDEKYKNLLYKTLQGYINYLTSNDYDPKTIRTWFSSLKKYLRKNGVNIYNEDVKVYLTFPKKLKERKYALEREDVLQLLRFMNDRYRTLFLFLSCTGCRIGESVALRKSDFDVTKDRIIVTLPAYITKTRESRITFVSKEVEPLILELLDTKENDDLVFGTNDTVKYSKDSITQMFGIIRKNAGYCTCSKENKDNCTGKYKSSPLHKITIHSFRAFFIKNINRVDFGLGNALGGHGYYMDRYDSMNEKEMIELYQKAEHKLAIYDKIESKEEIERKNKAFDDLKEQDLLKNEAISRLSDQIMMLTDQLEFVKTQYIASDKRKQDHTVSNEELC